MSLHTPAPTSRFASNLLRLPRWIALLAAVLALPSVASEAKGVLVVRARVIRSAHVQVATLATVQPVAPKAVKGGTEWRVPLHVSSDTGLAKDPSHAGVSVQVKDCQSARAELSPTAQGEKSLQVFVPEGASCAPVVVATVYPDGTPPDAETLQN